MEKKVPVLSSITARIFCLEVLHQTQRAQKSYQKQLGNRTVLSGSISRGKMTQPEPANDEQTINGAGGVKDLAKREFHSC